MNRFSIIIFAILLFAILLLPTAAPAEVDNTTFGRNHAFRLEYSGDGFGMRSRGVIELVNGGSKMYPLPQSSFETYMTLRPEALKLNPVTARGYERQEVIGPHQVEESRLWFGNHFYDGEGMRGVGAFGYFDMDTRRYELFRPPEVAPYEISAILVEQDSVWLGLDSFGEDISTVPGGLVRWNRETQQVRRYPLEFVVNTITRRGESLYLATNGGYAVLRNGALQRFATRKAANGETKSVPIDKFPPPPSHY
jgi:hypothetical protein